MPYIVKEMGIVSVFAHKTALTTNNKNRKQTRTTNKNKTKKKQKTQNKITK